MYFGGYFFLSVDYSVVFNYSNAGIEIFYVYIINCKYTAGVQPVQFVSCVKLIFHLILLFEMAF